MTVMQTMIVHDNFMDSRLLAELAVVIQTNPEAQNHMQHSKYHQIQTD